MSNFLQNLLDAGGPDEGLRGVVVGGDELLDGGDQLRYARKDSATNAFVGQFAKPPFDQIEPGRRGRSEVQMKARVLGQPPVDLRMFVRPVVVQDHVDVQLGWDAGIDLAQDLAELDIAMP